MQKAWRALNVPQCGYCQAGQIMQAAALIATNKNPSEEEINSAMSGNICRCGCYQRITAAITRRLPQERDMTTHATIENVSRRATATPTRAGRVLNSRRFRPLLPEFTDRGSSRCI